jgi:hypothetical protein
MQRLPGLLDALPPGLGDPAPAAPPAPQP